jgi:hypothetical protein
MHLWHWRAAQPTTTWKVTAPAQAPPAPLSADAQTFAEIRAHVLQQLAAAPAVEAGDEASRAAFLSDKTIRRFYAGNDGEVAPTAAQLVASWKWRVAVRPHATPCALCSRDPMAHSLRPVGFDALGRLVMYTCFATANDRFDPNHSIGHLQRLLEDAQSLLDSLDDRSTKWVLFIDFHGYTLRDSDPRAATKTVSLLTHYPERLGCILLFNSGMLFDGLWRIVCRVLRPSTRSKVSFVSSLGANDANLQALGAEMLSWLAAETAENRGAGALRKQYWTAIGDDGRPKPHDPRGLAPFVSDLKQWNAFCQYGALAQQTEAVAEGEDAADVFVDASSCWPSESSRAT